jgi:ElaB/YqjD/DUF883 family membrane-anchored ribosome-binding protein
MTDEEQQELIAMVAAARTIQSAAAKAVGDLTQLVADSRTIPGKIAQEGASTRQAIQKTGDQVLSQIARGAEDAIRTAAVSDVGAKIETAMTGPMQTIDKALKKLKESASTANLAADRWQMFTRTFRWQQLAIAVLVGILIGAVGHWYFVTRGPETEAAEYILFLKQGMDRKAAQADSSAETPVKSRRGGSGVKPRQRTHTSAESPSETAPATVPNPENADPPQ